MLAVLAPGQGSQRAGFLQPWINDPHTAAALEALALPPHLAAAGCDPGADVVDTETAQPLIVAAGLAAAQALAPWPAGTVFAGHSIGELTAVAAAGALSPAAAVRLAHARGGAMAKAAAEAAGGMTAVLGGDADEVLAAVEAAGACVANHNGPGQLVAAGAADAMERLAADPPARARLRPLPVAGAFHTALMRPAVEVFAAAWRGVAVSDPAHTLLSGLDGAAVRDASELQRRLTVAIVQPVRWDRCLTALRRLGVTGCLELPPAGVLTALVRRHLPHVEALAVTSPEDLVAARELIARHTRPMVADPVDLQLVVAPSDGTWRRAGRYEPTAAAGRPSKLLGRLELPRQSTEVHLPAGRRVTEWLAADGDPVRQGQPLARVSPEPGK